MTGYNAVIYPLMTHVKSVQQECNPGCWIGFSTAADLA
jgi:hypothetical protein